MVLEAVIILVGHKLACKTTIYFTHESEHHSHQPSQVR